MITRPSVFCCAGVRMRSCYDQPIGISDYQLSKAIPEKLKSALPSVEEVEEELTLFLDKDKNP